MREGEKSEQLAIEGYDSVAYWDGDGAQTGAPEFSCRWAGRDWRFTNQERLDRFRAQPERYAPQYDGLCAFGLSLGREAKGSPQHFLVQDDRLFLQSNGLVSMLFRLIPGRAQAALRYWTKRQA